MLRSLAEVVRLSLRLRKTSETTDVGECHSIQPQMAENHDDISTMTTAEVIFYRPQEQWGCLGGQHLRGLVLM